MFKDKAREKPAKIIQSIQKVIALHFYPDWVNAEIQSFDWFTSLKSKCLNQQMYKTAGAPRSSIVSKWLQFSVLLSARRICHADEA